MSPDVSTTKVFPKSMMAMLCSVVVMLTMNLLYSTHHSNDSEGVTIQVMIAPMLVHAVIVLT